MKLFIVESSLLGDAAAWPESPASGDAVLYFSRSQDPTGEGGRSLEAAGIRVIDGHKLLGFASEQAIDAKIADFITHWNVMGNRRLGVVEGLSLLQLAQRELVHTCQPGFLIRFGEICRAALGLCPGADRIVTDVKDGETPLGLLPPRSLPKLSLLRAIVAPRPASTFAPSGETAPPYFVTKFTEHPLLAVAKRFFGGLRPAYLFPWLDLLTRSGRKKRVYVHLNHELNYIARGLAADPQLTVMCDQVLSSSTRPVRFDHFFPWLGPRWWRALFELYLHARRPQRHAPVLVNGFNYLPFVLHAPRYFTGLPMLRVAVEASQTLRMLRSLRPDLVIVNGEGSPNARTTIQSDRRFGYKVVYIGHGWRLIPWGHSAGMNYPNVVLAVPGARNMDFYASKLPQQEKPRRVNLPLTITYDFVTIRGQKVPATRPRVLFLALGPAWPDTIARVGPIDDFIADVLSASRALVERGFQVTLRHKKRPFNSRFFSYWIKKHGMAGMIQVSSEGSFRDAVLNTDVIVTGSSTAYYQALAAGRPTLFYEPQFEPSRYTGLVAREDLPVPVARSADEIVQLVSEAAQGRGPVAEFAKLFCANLADDYIGRSPETAVEQLTRFVIDELRQSDGGGPSIARQGSRLPSEALS